MTNYDYYPHIRTALLRQTPVDPRKKPKGALPAPDTSECASPVDMGRFIVG